MSNAVRSQVVDFSWSTTTGTYCAPQKVTFTQNCTPAPGGFIWNFGNGNSNVHASDTTIYLNPGTYNVTLIALYADSARPKTKTITINPTPSVSLTADKASICTPGDINFTATAGLSSYQWIFGDGSPMQTTSTNTVTHAYTGFGTFTATVIGVSSFGCIDSAHYDIEVRQFTIGGNVMLPNGCIPATSTFTVTADIPAGDAAQTYLWDFGDGSPPETGTTPSATHTFNVTGVIVPHLIITTVNGCSSSYDFLGVGYGAPPININAITISGRDTFCGRETVEFKATALNATEYMWNFGGGAITTTTDSLISHKYSDTGHMRVIVTAMSYGCPGAKDTIDILIRGVIAKYDISNSCSNKNIFTFKDTSAGTVSHYEWSFSNSPGILDSTHFDITHSFPLTGDHLVMLTVIDSASMCTDTLQTNIYTAQPVFSSNKTSVCKDSLITYTVSNTYSNLAGYEYRFFVDGNNVDNGGNPVLVIAPHNFGTFNDRVIIKNSNPHICSDTLYLTPPTRVTGPVTSFTISDDTVCLRIPVSFNNTSHPFFLSDNIIDWHWDFGDGNTSGIQSPSNYLYTSVGKHYVYLTATDINGCAIKVRDSVYIDPIPEMTVYPRMDTICLGRDTSLLTAYTIDPFIWTPVSNLSCISSNCDTIKVYPSVTTMYIATATNIGGCSASDTSLVKVYAPFNIAASPLNAGICPTMQVSLNVNTNGIIRWSPPAGLNDSTLANPIASPDITTDYTVIVTDSAHCYADTASLNVQVFDSPSVNAGPDLVLPYGTAFTLHPTYGINVQTYLWSPAGDLSCTNCAQPSGIAEGDITYSIKVTDINGCTNKDSIKITLLCDQSSLYMPSAFSPFNGGANNYFYPLARGYRTIKSFIVYNRYGNKVFERKDFRPGIPSLGWDGKISGSDRQSTEAFVWYVEAVCPEGEMVSLKGTVLLIR